LKGLESAAALVGNGGAGTGFGTDTMQMSLFGALAGSNMGASAYATDEQSADMDSDIDHDFADDDSFEFNANPPSAMNSASTMTTEHPLIAELRDLDVNAMTPMQALIHLAKMKEQI
jgi:hypothetical protein